MEGTLTQELGDHSELAPCVPSELDKYLPDWRSRRDLLKVRTWLRRPGDG